MSTIRTTITVQRLVGTKTTVFYPQAQEDVASSSTLYHQTMQLVGLVEELLSVGEVTNNASLHIVNNHASAIVSVGIVVAAVFYPVFKINPGTIAKLPIVNDLAGLYLKSDVADTPVELLLAKVAA